MVYNHQTHPTLIANAFIALQQICVCKFETQQQLLLFSCYLDIQLDLYSFYLVLI